jgi:hypothetical protein
MDVDALADRIRHALSDVFMEPTDVAIGSSTLRY